MIAILAGDTRVRNSTEISGALELANGETAAGDTILVFTDDGYQTVTIDERGEYALTLPSRVDPYQLQYYRHSNLSDITRDGFVDMYAVATVPGDTDSALETTRLPEGHLVDVTVVDEGGDPVTGAWTRLYHNNTEMYAKAGIANLTTENGTIQFGEESGVELNGAVDIVVEPPEGDNRFVNRTYEQTIEVTDNMTPEVVLEENTTVPQFDVDPTEPDVNETVTFNASASIGNLTAYEWNFGDGATATGSVVTHSFDTIDTYDVTLTVTDDNGTTKTVTEPVSVGGHTAIEHGDGTTTSDSGVYADAPTIRTTVPDATVEFGGEANTTFWINNTKTGESVTVTANESTVSVPADRIAFLLYNSSGTLLPEEGLFVEAIAPDGSATTIPVDVDGDHEMFENASTFSTYEISLVDAERNVPIGTTDERLMGIGYEATLEQDSTDGDINVTISRDSTVDESWNATFELINGTTHERVLSQPVEHDGSAGEFAFTVDADTLDDGEYTWHLTLESSDQEPAVQRLRDQGFVVQTVEEDKSDDSGSAPSPPSMPAPTPSEPASFDLGALDLPTTVEAGESIPVSVLVANTGEEAGTADVTLTLDDEVVGEDTLEVAAGANDTLTFEVTAPETAGEATVTIQTADDETTATVTVTDDEDPAEEDDPADSEDPADTDESDENNDSDETDDSADTDESDDANESAETNESADADNDSSEAADQVDEDPVNADDDTDTVPGFGGLSALVAMLAGALLIARRR
ncbi:PKD domain-containing protein [Natronosalvus rutilus]|uniref:PKD domain-containing protein n=1 Tax=Natronosalvus rutilus TaxID=2953753 RepID=A0A9E7SX79_9EURY|nr:PKD domain-containing protein [Natronosalvus rutilus]UTF54761.1 PKD domain-containing protein [Natronosalvus rutilus]